MQHAFTGRTHEFQASKYIKTTSCCHVNKDRIPTGITCPQNTYKN